MGVIIKFRSDERKNINNLMIQLFNSDFEYSLHIRRMNGENSGDVKIEKTNLRDCEDIINNCKVDIISTVIDEEM